jgi:hypothetical protein
MSTTRPQGPEGGETRRLVPTGTGGVIGQCRDFTRTALNDWGWLPTCSDQKQAAAQQVLAEDVLLLVSELVTNACLYAGGPSELLLRCTGAVLRVEVSDRSAALPVPQAPHQASRPGGHGLHLVDRLSQDWGTAVRTTGKTVWLEVGPPVTGG